MSKKQNNIKYTSQFETEPQNTCGIKNIIN